MEDEMEGSSKSPQDLEILRQMPEQWGRNGKSLQDVESLRQMLEKQERVLRRGQSLVLPLLLQPLFPGLEE